MLEVIKTFILCIIQVLSCIYVMNILTDEKIKLTTLKNVLISIVIVLMFFMSISLELGVVKPILMYVILIVGFKNMYNISFNQSTICSFINMIITGLSEVIISLAIILLKVPQSIIQKYLTMSPLAGLVSFGLVILIMSISKKGLLKIKEILYHDNITTFFYLSMAVGISLLLGKNMNNWRENKDFIVNCITILLFIAIIFILFREKYKIHVKNNEFNELFKQSQDISTLLEKYQKYNHENKNQLIVIKEKAQKNKSLVEYIDSILEENINPKDKWIEELSLISDTGIRGFLSVKINKMIDNGIKVVLTVSPKIKRFKFNKIKTKGYKDLCRVIGVYLDNAYEASKETKQKEVTIELDVDGDQLRIIISNSFKNDVDIHKVDDIGYSTKGRERGIGLSLVKDILINNSYITQKRDIIKNYYFQYLYVKI